MFALQKQMTNMDTFKEVSNQPPISRDMSYLVDKNDREDLIKVLSYSLVNIPESLSFFNWNVINNLLLKVDIGEILIKGMSNYKTLGYLDWNVFVNFIDKRWLKKILTKYLETNWLSYDYINWELVCHKFGDLDLVDLLTTALTSNKLILQNIRWEQFSSKLTKRDIIELCALGVKSSNLALMESSMRSINFNLLKECYDIDPVNDRIKIIMKGSR
jgi:hypothetical protein